MEKAKESGGLLRDTLVHALANLAEVVVRAAFRDYRVRQQYRRWLRQAQEYEIAGQDTDGDSRRLALVQVGVGNGLLVLLATGQQGEFIVFCDHAAFEALVVARVDQRRGQVRDVWLAHFEGNLIMGSDFAHAMEEHICTRTTLPQLCADIEGDMAAVRELYRRH